MKYDVIVVGAGPAGLMAARELEKAHLNYLVIDSKKKIGEPLRCGEGLRLSYADELFDKKSMTRQNGFYERTGLEFRTPTVQRRFDVPFCELDRPVFEKWLSTPVKKGLMMQTACKDIIIKEDYAEVITDNATFQCDIAILCYGANFGIQKRYGLIKKDASLMKCYGALVKNHKMKNSDLTFYYDCGPLGAFWLFPKGNHIANIGVGTLAKADLKKDFNRMFKEIPELKEARPYYTYAGCVPCSGPIEKTYSDRMLVCGDAAGLTHAASGEGICYALMSGKLAGQVASDACRSKNFSSMFLKNYEKLWKKRMFKLIKSGLTYMVIAKLVYKYQCADGALKSIGENEIKGMISKGKMPFRISLLLKLAKMFGAVKNFEQRKKLPIMAKKIYYLLRPAK